MNATRVFPQKRPVFLGGSPDEGGRLYLVTPMKVKHLAFLQALVEAQNPHPYYDVAGGPRPGESEDDYHDRKLDALDACEGWPPSLTDAKTWMRSTPEQRVQRYVYELYVGLRNDSKPRPGREECLALLGASYQDQLDLFEDVLWDGDLKDRLIRTFDPDFGRSAGGGGPLFSETIDSVSRSRNWTYRQVGDLYLSQLSSVLKQGKLDEEDTVPIPNLPSFNEEWHMPGREAELKDYGERRFAAKMKVVERQRAKFGRRKPPTNQNGNGNGHGGAV